MPEISQELRDYVARLIKSTEQLSLGLSIRANFRFKVKHTVELASVLAGLLALGVGVYPETLGPEGSAISVIIVFVSGGMLIFSVLLDRFFRDPPERFRDYAFYIGRYESSIREIMLDDTDEYRMGRLREVTRLADINLNDVRKNWPDLYKKYTLSE